MAVALGGCLGALDRTKRSDDGRNQQEGVAREHWGTISGTVLLGPNCPVEDPNDPNCADKPYKPAGTLTLIYEALPVVQEFSVKPDGTFRLEAPPGRYVIRSTIEGVHPYCMSNSFTLDAEGSVEVTVRCDTGIR